MIRHPNLFLLSNYLRGMISYILVHLIIFFFIHPITQKLHPVRCCGVHLREEPSANSARGAHRRVECRAHSPTAHRSSKSLVASSYQFKARPGRRKIARARLGFQRIADVYDLPFSPDYLSIADRAFLLKDSAAFAFGG